jgi:hypothetical protein
MHGGQLEDGMANELESVTPAGRELAGTVPEAFTRHRLVGIGESYGLQNHHDALQMLLTDPRLPAALDDIVVEFGNACYPDTVDRFIAGGRSPTPTFAWCGGTPCSHPGRPGTRRSASSWRETQAARGISAPQPARAKDLPQSARRTRVTGLPPGDAPVPAG